MLDFKQLITFNLKVELQVPFLLYTQHTRAFVEKLQKRLIQLKDEVTVLDPNYLVEYDLEHFVAKIFSGESANLEIEHVQSQLATKIEPSELSPVTVVLRSKCEDIKRESYVYCVESESANSVISLTMDRSKTRSLKKTQSTDRGEKMNPRSASVDDTHNSGYNRKRQLNGDPDPSKRKRQDIIRKARSMDTRSEYRRKPQGKIFYDTTKKVSQSDVQVSTVDLPTVTESISVPRTLSRSLSPLWRTGQPSYADILRGSFLPSHERGNHGLILSPSKETDLPTSKDIQSIRTVPEIPNVIIDELEEIKSNAHADLCYYFSIPGSPESSTKEGFIQEENESSSQVWCYKQGDFNFPEPAHTIDRTLPQKSHRDADSESTNYSVPDECETKLINDSNINVKNKDEQTIDTIEEQTAPDCQINENTSSNGSSIVVIPSNKTFSLQTTRSLSSDSSKNSSPTSSKTYADILFSGASLPVFKKVETNITVTETNIPSRVKPNNEHFRADSEPRESRNCQKFLITSKAKSFDVRSEGYLGNDSKLFEGYTPNPNIPGLVFKDCKVVPKIKKKKQKKVTKEHSFIPEFSIDYPKNITKESKIKGIIPKINDDPKNKTTTIVFPAKGTNSRNEEMSAREVMQAKIQDQLIFKEVDHEINESKITGKEKEMTAMMTFYGISSGELDRQVSTEKDGKIVKPSQKKKKKTKKSNSLSKQSTIDDEIDLALREINDMEMLRHRSTEKRTYPATDFGILSVDFQTESNNVLGAPQTNEKKKTKKAYVKTQQQETISEATILKSVSSEPPTETKDLTTVLEDASLKRRQRMKKGKTVGFSDGSQQVSAVVRKDVSNIYTSIENVSSESVQLTIETSTPDIKETPEDRPTSALGFEVLSMDDSLFKSTVAIQKRPSLASQETFEENIEDTFEVVEAFDIQEDSQDNFGAAQKSIEHEEPNEKTILFPDPCNTSITQFSCKSSEMTDHMPRKISVIVYEPQNEETVQPIVPVSVPSNARPDHTVTEHFRRLSAIGHIFTDEEVLVPLQEGAEETMGNFIEASCCEIDPVIQADVELSSVLEVVPKDKTGLNCTGVCPLPETEVVELVKTQNTVNQSFDSSITPLVSENNSVIEAESLALETANTSDEASQLPFKDAVQVTELSNINVDDQKGNFEHDNTLSEGRCENSIIPPVKYAQNNGEKCTILGEIMQKHYLNIVGGLGSSEAPTADSYVDVNVEQIVWSEVGLEDMCSKVTTRPEEEKNPETFDLVQNSISALEIHEPSSIIEAPNSLSQQRPATVHTNYDISTVKLSPAWKIQPVKHTAGQIHKETESSTSMVKMNDASSIPSLGSNNLPEDDEIYNRIREKRRSKKKMLSLSKDKSENDGKAIESSVKEAIDSNAVLTFTKNQIEPNDQGTIIKNEVKDEACSSGGKLNVLERQNINESYNHTLSHEKFSSSSTTHHFSQNSLLEKEVHIESSFPNTEIFKNEGCPLTYNKSDSSLSSNRLDGEISSEFSEKEPVQPISSENRHDNSLNAFLQNHCEPIINVQDHSLKSETKELHSKIQDKEKIYEIEITDDPLYKLHQNINEFRETEDVNVVRSTFFSHLNGKDNDRLDVNEKSKARETYSNTDSLSCTWMSILDSDECFSMDVEDEEEVQLESFSIPTACLEVKHIIPHLETLEGKDSAFIKGNEEVIVHKTCLNIDPLSSAWMCVLDSSEKSSERFEDEDKLQPKLKTLPLVPTILPAAKPFQSDLETESEKDNASIKGSKEATVHNPSSNTDTHSCAWMSMLDSSEESPIKFEEEEQLQPESPSLLLVPTIHPTIKPIQSVSETVDGKDNAINKGKGEGTVHMVSSNTDTLSFAWMSMLDNSEKSTKGSKDEEKFLQGSCISPLVPRILPAVKPIDSDLKTENGKENAFIEGDNEATVHETSSSIDTVGCAWMSKLDSKTPAVKPTQSDLEAENGKDNALIEEDEEATALETSSKKDTLSCAWMSMLDSSEKSSKEFEDEEELLSEPCTLPLVPIIPPEVKSTRSDLEIEDRKNNVLIKANKEAVVHKTYPNLDAINCAWMSLLGNSEKSTICFEDEEVPQEETQTSSLIITNCPTIGPSVKDWEANGKDLELNFTDLCIGTGSYKATNSAVCLPLSSSLKVEGTDLKNEDSHLLEDLILNQYNECFTNENLLLNMYFDDWPSFEIDSNLIGFGITCHNSCEAEKETEEKIMQSSQQNLMEISKDPRDHCLFLDSWPDPACLFLRDIEKVWQDSKLPCYCLRPDLLNSSHVTYANAVAHGTPVANKQNEAQEPIFTDCAPKIVSVAEEAVLPPLPVDSDGFVSYKNRRDMRRRLWRTSISKSFESIPDTHDILTEIGIEHESVPVGNLKGLENTEEEEQTISSVLYKKQIPNISRVSKEIRELERKQRRARLSEVEKEIIQIAEAIEQENSFVSQVFSYDFSAIQRAETAFEIMKAKLVELEPKTWAHIVASGKPILNQKELQDHPVYTEKHPQVMITEFPRENLEIPVDEEGFKAFKNRREMKRSHWRSSRSESISVDKTDESEEPESKNLETTSIDKYDELESDTSFEDESIKTAMKSKRIMKNQKCLAEFEKRRLKNKLTDEEKQILAIAEAIDHKKPLPSFVSTYSDIPDAESCFEQLKAAAYQNQELIDPCKERGPLTWAHIVAFGKPITAIVEEELKVKYIEKLPEIILVDKRPSSEPVPVDENGFAVHRNRREMRRHQWRSSCSESFDTPDLGTVHMPMAMPSNIHRFYVGQYEEERNMLEELQDTSVLKNAEPNDKPKKLGKDKRELADLERKSRKNRLSESEKEAFEISEQIQGSKTVMAVKFAIVAGKEFEVKQGIAEAETRLALLLQKDCKGDSEAERLDGGKDKDEELCNETPTDYIYGEEGLINLTSVSLGFQHKLECEESEIQWLRLLAKESPAYRNQDEDNSKENDENQSHEEQGHDENLHEKTSKEVNPAEIASASDIPEQEFISENVHSDSFRQESEETPCTPVIESKFQHYCPVPWSDESTYIGKGATLEPKLQQLQKKVFPLLLIFFRLLSCFFTFPIFLLNFSVICLKF